MAEDPAVQPIPRIDSPVLTNAPLAPRGGLPVQLYSGAPVGVPQDPVEQAGAAWRSNWLGSFLSTPSGPTFVEQGFDAVAAANRVDLPEDRAELSNARSQAEFDTMLRYALQRRQDRNVALQNPLTHMFFTSALDPTSYTVVGAPWIRAGASIAERALRGAIGGALTFGATEGLHSIIDPHVTMTDVEQAVVGGAIMGGLIGSILPAGRPSAAGAGAYFQGGWFDAGRVARREAYDVVDAARVAEDGTVVPPTLAFGPARGDLATRPAQTVQAVQAAQTGRPFSAVLYRGVNTARAEHAAAQGVEDVATGANTLGVATYFGIDLPTARGYALAHGQAGNLQAVEVHLRNPFVLGNDNTSLQRLVELFRPHLERAVARSAEAAAELVNKAPYMPESVAAHEAHIAALRAEGGEDAVRNYINTRQAVEESTGDLLKAQAAAQEVPGTQLPRFDNLLQQAGYDGLILRTDAHTLYKQIEHRLRLGDIGPEDSLYEMLGMSKIDRMSLRSILFQLPAEHPQIAVFDAGRSGIQLGTAGQRAQVNIGKLFTINRPAFMLQTIGRIAPMDDWGVIPGSLFRRSRIVAPDVELTPHPSRDVLPDIHEAYSGVPFKGRLETINAAEGIYRGVGPLKVGEGTEVNLANPLVLRAGRIGEVFAVVDQMVAKVRARIGESPEAARLKRQHEALNPPGAEDDLMGQVIGGVLQQGMEKSLTINVVRAEVEHIVKSLPDLAGIAREYGYDGLIMANTRSQIRKIIYHEIESNPKMPIDDRIVLKVIDELLPRGVGPHVQELRPEAATAARIEHRRLLSGELVREDGKVREAYPEEPGGRIAIENKDGALIRMVAGDERKQLEASGAVRRTSPTHDSEPVLRTTETPEGLALEQTPPEHPLDRHLEEASPEELAADAQQQEIEAASDQLVDMQHAEAKPEAIQAQEEKIAALEQTAAVEGPPPAVAQPVGAAPVMQGAITQTGDLQPMPTGLLLERLGMTPMGRLISSPIDAVAAVMLKLSSVPYLIKANMRGVANPGNVASDQFPWMQRLAHVLQDYDEAYMAQRGVSRVRAIAQDLGAAGGRPANVLSAKEFDDRVWLRLHAQADDAMPEVNRAAASMRSLYDEMGDAAAGAGMFDIATVRTPKIWDTATGRITESYVPRQWHIRYIEANRGAFTAKVEDWLRKSGGDVSQANQIVEDILLDRPYRPIDDEHVGLATSAQMRKFNAPSTEFQQFLVTDPKELLQHYTRTMGIDVSLTNRAGSVNAKALIDDASEEWFRDIGRRTGRDGQAAFDTMQAELERIANDTSANYADLERRYAGAPPLDEIALVRDQGMARKTAALDQARLELDASKADWDHFNQDISDIRAVRDLLRGTYGQWDQSRDWVPRALAAARKVAMMNSLTGIVSQLSDVGAIVLKEGFTRTFGTAFDALRAGMPTIKLAMREAQLFGTALDMKNSGRVMAMGDLSADIAGRHTLFERALDKATQVSFYVNGMNQWNTFAKGWAAMVVMSRIADDVDKVAGQAIRTGLVDLHVQDATRLHELDHLIDGRTLTVPATPAQRTAWIVERAQRQATLGTLGNLTGAEQATLALRVQKELATNPTLLTGGITRDLSDAAARAQAQRRLDSLTTGHEKAMARLARAGIDPEMAAEISAQIGRHQTVAGDILRLPNSERWSHADARKAFSRAVVEDVDNAVVGADAPGRSLWLSKPLGQTIGMFQAYGQAVVQKLMIPALQEKDSRVLSGMALMIGAGYLSDQLRRAMTGNTTPQSATDTIYAAIDRSGVTGWFGQLFNAASNMFDKRYGPGFAGEAQPVPTGMPYGLTSSPDHLIRALGPAATSARNLVDLTFRTATMNWGPETARDARRLLPFNNVTHTYFIYDMLEKLLANQGRSEPVVQQEGEQRQARRAAAMVPAAAAAGQPAPPSGRMPRQPNPARQPTADQLRGPPPAAAQPVLQ